jgi:DNA-directed RNA polymerase beta subunit
MKLTPVMAHPTDVRERIRARAVEGLKAAFPLDIRGQKIELEHVEVHQRDFGPEAQKQALLEGSTLHEPVKATLVLKNAEGKVTDRVKNFTLLHLPYFTERHSFIVDGNEYQVSNQIRMKPGVYTRRRANEELEAAFNLSKGSNFRLSLDPRKGHPYMEYGTTQIPLYPILRKLGVPHGDIAKSWGSEIAAANESEFGKDKKMDQSLDKLYGKLLHPAKQTHTTIESKLQAVRDAYALTSMDGEVNETTLGHAHEKVTPHALMDASKKLLTVYKSGEDVDDRDSLAYKTFHSVDDFIRERIGLDARTVAMKVKGRATNKTTLREIMPSAPFTNGVRSFLTGSQLSAIPTQINPMELIDHSVKVTSLGEGGISSERAIPMEARQLHPTHFGILDPVRTPECVDRETEVFTQTGWQLFSEVTSATALACRVAGRLEFHPPEHLFAKRYVGKMYGVRTGTHGTIEYLVTPNHRVWSRPDYPGAEYRMDLAESVAGKTRWFTGRHLSARGSGAPKFVLPEVKRRNGRTERKRHFAMGDWAEFMGWWLSEGSVTCDETRPQYQVQISQSLKANPDCHQRIEHLLLGMRLPYTFTNGNTFLINSKQLAQHLIPFGYCNQKYIPEYLFDASVGARQRLFDALLLGDGRVVSTRSNGHTYNQRVFCTTSARLAVDFECLAIGLGLTTRTARYEDKREERYLPLYEVRVLQAAEHNARESKGHFYTVDYDGMVYCAQVPGNMLLIRRNGSVPIWTGNSFKAGVDIRASMLAHRDAKGNLYTPVRDVNTKQIYNISAKDLAHKIVAFPGQKMTGRVDVMKGGKVQSVDAKEVQYEIYHASQFYSPTTNLVPLMESIQGNRATMGSKMQTQALPLVHREVPWLQVGSQLIKDHNGKAVTENSSFERELAKLIVATAPSSGKIVKIDHQYIYIDPSGKKHAEYFVKNAKVKRQQTVGGVTLKIELEPGDKRTGTSPEGKTWEKIMSCAYGYIPKTEGDDDECVDVYLNTLDPTFLQVYVVHQKKKDGGHDEDKVMLGYANEAAATAAYKLHGPEWGLGKVDQYSWEDFKDDYLEEARKEASDKELIRVPYETNFPFASKTYLHQDVTAKVGDHVQAGDALSESNFTRNGTLALGRNMRVAYLPYYGLNSNDAVVISEGAAEKLTSEHMYKEILDVDPEVTLGKNAHRQHYGAKYLASMYAKLDDDGVVKKGSKVMPHDLLIAGLRKGKLSATDILLGNIKKTLANPYREEVRDWHHDFEGEVIDVYKSPRRVVVTVKTREPMRIGDKISGRIGNKGVVAHILPDHKMIQDENGRPLDILLTSAGVISRINPTQIIETAVAKVAEKLGHPIVVESFSGRDNVQWAKDLMKQHGVKDKETVFDPVSGKKMPGVLVGLQYMFKLFKTTDSNYAARGGGGYDINRQPTKGGDEGAKALGKMEMNALIAHNARNVLREATTLKSEQNDEFWRAIQLGLPLPALKTPFVYDKMLAMLQGAGVQVDKRGNQLTLRPMTDNDVKKLSGGAIENDKLVRAKDLKPEKGGFFDPVITGGATGTRWSHMDLAEPLVNPIFQEPARRLLGLSTKDFDAAHFNDGGASIKKRLNAIDLADKEKELRTQSKTFKGTKLDDVVKQIKYIKALQKVGLKAGDAYVISKIAVLPPVMRPILPGKGGQEMVVGDSNYLYQNAFLHNTTLKRQVASPVLPPDEHVQLRKNLFQAVGAVVGTHDTDNQKLLKRNVKGFMEHLTGKTTPKCYSSDTDVLTEDGWVPFPEYHGQRVGTVNLTTQAFEWQTPTEIIHEAYTGPMLLTQSRELDLLVTPNHQHVASFRRKRVLNGIDTYVWTPFERTPASRFMSTDRRRVMVSAETWAEGRYTPLTFEGAPSKPYARGRPRAEPCGVFTPHAVSFAEFVGWWVAEGWISSTGAQASLAQAATSPHVAQIDHCFASLNLPFERKVYTRTSGYQTIWWTIKLRSVATWLIEHCGSGSANKKLSQEILSWPPEMLRAVLDGYVHGDGALHPDKVVPAERKTRKRKKINTAHACSVSLRLVDDLQQLGLKIGYHVVFRSTRYPTNPKHLPIHLFSVRGFSDVTIEAGTFTKTVPYDGIVHCVTVPNGTVVVRRNGKPAVSGNSSFFQKKIEKKQQDLSGRGTAVPDGALGMDQVGIPEDMLWGMFGKFVIARLVRRGFQAVKAKEMVEAKHPAARDALLAEVNERPVMLNRAPTLHRYNVVGAYAVPTAGKTISVNPFIEPGMNLDYDGDEQVNQVVCALSQPELYSKEWRDAHALGDTMAARIRDNVACTYGGKFYLCDLADFPRTGEPDTRGHIDFYAVPPGVQVVAYDEVTGSLALRDVASWSVHHGRAIEIVTLASGRQIITDDDPRAVYGVKSDLNFHRSRPKDSVGVFVPRAHDLGDIPVSIHAVKLPASSSRLKPEAVCDTAFGRLAGTIAGDGWASTANGDLDGHVCLAAADESIAAQFKEDLLSVFRDAPQVGVVERIGGDFGADVKSTKYVVSCLDFARWVSSNIGHGAADKQLPPFFPHTPREFRLGLLAGLLDTDGSIAVNKAKAKPQWLINFSTKSLRLARELVLLCRTLGVRAQISATKTPKGDAFWQVPLSTVDMHKLGALPAASPEKKRRFDEFFSSPSPVESSSYSQHDKVPTPPEVSARLSKLYGNTGSEYVRLRKATRTGYMSRSLAKQVLAEHPEIHNEELLRTWLFIVNNEKVRWDPVVSFEVTNIVETGYDLTVLGHETFMAVDGVILSNTLMVHTPVLPGAVEDVRNMTMSHLLFGDRQKEDLLVFPRMEAVLGLHQATKAGVGKVHVFKTKADAMAAYKAGTLKLDDNVEIK